MSDFVHLHVHSEYSLLDGLAHPKDIAARAVELNQRALALTDHGTMFAAIEFYDACKAKGIQPIIGVEAYLAKRSLRDRDPKEDRSSYHLLLLAENNVGYQNLLKLVSTSELEGFYYYPRMDRDLLAQHSAGLICTTGCPSAPVPRLLHEGKRDEARKMMGWLKDVFADRLYVELQEHGIAEFAGLNKQLVELARDFNLPLVATNDAHYIRPEDANAQDVLLCIQTGTVMTDPKRMRMDGSDYYLKSSDEMKAVWHELPEAIANTLVVAERCNVNLDFKEFHLPVVTVPEGYSPETYLRYICEHGFQRYYPNGNAPARERLDYELGVIHTMGFDTYFLIVWDLIRAARERNIWYNVRGSAAGSMAAYCAGITNLDPIQHRLIFERFLNPGRISMPDIDLDFQDDRRAELIEYTTQKYGKDNVAQIITFGTLGAKAAIRDVGRALDYPLPEVDRVAKLIPTGPNIKLKDTLEKVPEFRDAYESSDYIRRLIDNAILLEGVARNAGTHAAGVVVADKPIVEYAPLHRPTKGDSTGGGFPVVEFEMNHLERVGLLKMDYLGLASLTIMRRACELIKQRHGVDLDLGNIPVEDPKAFDLLARGDVTGVFQVEGAGLRKVLQQMKPTRFDHIVAAISLYRPGPLEYIPNYIARLHGTQKVEYRHPALEPILSDTFGIMIYQEQIIEIAVKLAGYSASEGDVLRKAVGKKDKEKLLKERDKFIAHAEKHGVISGEIAGQIFDDVEFFARYGFNKSHAADYAVLTCQTAYLKAHYPIEYMTALLMTKFGNMDDVAQLVSEARRMGYEIHPPDVNTSDVQFTIDANGKGIHFALSAIKNVGVGAVEVIVEARKKDGAFKSLDDFCRRVDLRLVNRRVLESLIKAGALDRFGRRAQLLKVLDRMMTASQSAHSASDRGQMSLFGAASPSAAASWGATADTFGVLPDEPEIPNRDKLAAEKELTGAYFSDNPVMRLARGAQKDVTHFVNQLDESSQGKTVTFAGVVTNTRVIQTKKGDTMVFVSMEDPTGDIELTVFPKTYNKTRDLWHVEMILLVTGKIEHREGKVQLLVDSAREYEIPTTDDRPSVVDNQPPVTSQSSPVVQFAMPNSEEAAIADAVVMVEEIVADMPGDLPPPPEEPPSEFAELPKTEKPPVASPPPPLPDLPIIPDLPPAARVRSYSSNGNGDTGHVKAHAAKETGSAYAPRHVRIKLERTNDYDEDMRRMREVFRVLTSASGRDRFTFYVPNQYGTVQLDFPNHTTSYGAVEPLLSEFVGEWCSLEVQ